MLDKNIIETYMKAYDLEENEVSLKIKEGFSLKLAELKLEIKQIFKEKNYFTLPIKQIEENDEYGLYTTDTLFSSTVQDLSIYGDYSFGDEDYKILISPKNEFGLPLQLKINDVPFMSNKDIKRLDLTKEEKNNCLKIKEFHTIRTYILELTKCFPEECKNLNIYSLPTDNLSLFKLKELNKDLDIVKFRELNNDLIEIELKNESIIKKVKEQDNFQLTL